MPWQNFPLLLYSLAFLVGMTLQPLSILPLTALLMSCQKSRYWALFIVGAAGFTWGYTASTPPPPGVYPGEALFHPHSLSRKTFHGKPHFIAEGRLRQFQTEGRIYKEIPVTLTFRVKPPDMDTDYAIEGILKLGPYGWQLKPTAHSPFRKIEAGYSFAESRYQAKESVKKYLETSLSDPRAAALLSGLATGEFDDRALKYDFLRFGLTHLLAISGFHFSLLAAFLGYLISPFFPPRVASFLLLLLIGGYFLFLGESPSILRAAITIALAMTAPLLSHRSRQENTLGFALLTTLILDPFAPSSLAFQMSFLSAGALVFLSGPMEGQLKKWLPQRPPQLLYQVNKRSRPLMALLVFIRKTVALNLSLALVAIPATLCLFQQFPLLSLVYNLFFPALLSLSLFLLLLSLPFPFLHSVNSAYTGWILNLTHELPPSFDLTLTTQLFTQEITLGIIVIVFYYSLRFRLEN